MFLQLKECANKHMVRHFITVPDKFKMPSYFHINIYEHNIILGFNFKVYDITDGQCYIAISISQDPIIYKHLRNLSEYI